MQALTDYQEISSFPASVQAALRKILTNLRVEAHYDRIIEEVKREPLYARLNVTWEKLEAGARRERWQTLLERMVKIAYASRPYCLRCGECCRRGSPSLHIEDMELFSRRILSTDQIYTLRRGEPVLYNIEGRIDVLSEELVKIKEDSESHHCFFYREEGKSCLIYQNRPIQCRVQECWNPETLRQLWSRQKLSRRHLLSHDSELLELLQVHDQRCAPKQMDSAFKQLSETGDAGVLDQVLNFLRQDFIVRKFFVKKLGRNEDELDFLLGRPATVIVKSYGMKVERDNEGVYHLLEDTPTRGESTTG
jgi:Fe-S-cluster containining protein